MGFPALWSAANHGKTEEVRRLLKEGADIEEKLGPRASSALHAAVYQNREAVLRLLLDSGADWQANTIDGSTPEDIATAHGHLQIVAMLQAEAGRRAQCVAVSRDGAGPDLAL